MTKTFAKDMEMGTNGEKSVLNLLRYKYPKIKQLDKYNRLDYETPNCFIELKTRRINFKQYPTMLIDYSKLIHAKKQKKDVFFYFNLNDGLYYVNTKDLILDKNYTIETFKRGYRKGYNDKFHEVIYIDMNILKKFKLGK